MIDFIAMLKSRNEPLFYFGLICFLVAGFMLLMAKFSDVQINGVNAWFKPFKFALSIGIFSWTMGCYTGYPELSDKVSAYSWTTIILLGFELFYISFQAARGQLSHYNLSSSLYTSLTAAMAFAAIAVTLYTGYIGILFCTREFPELPGYYLWAIRLGIFLFVVFAFEGAIMGANVHIVWAVRAMAMVCRCLTGAANMAICVSHILWACMLCRYYPSLLVTCSGTLNGLSFQE